jgi:hypothetical protein
MMGQGTCKLCLQNKPLVLSHFMPKALYAYCREGEFHPVQVGHGRVISTDRQTTDYLLCLDCEDVINKGGETWLTPKLATVDRRFPFYDLLTARPADLEEERIAFYFAASNPEIKVDKLTHFAMALFWKAAVHSWSGHAREPRIDLGPYAERIRKWLLGEADFPAHVYLTVMVSRPLRAQIVFNDPWEGKRQANRNYFTHVPGIMFMLTVGKQMPTESSRICLHKNPGHPIIISDELTDKFERQFARMYLESRKTAAFLRSKAKRAAPAEPPGGGKRRAD